MNFDTQTVGLLLFYLVGAILALTLTLLYISTKKR